MVEREKKKITVKQCHVIVSVQLCLNSLFLLAFRFRSCCMQLLDVCLLQNEFVCFSRMRLFVIDKRVESHVFEKVSSA